MKPPLTPQAQNPYTQSSFHQSESNGFNQAIGKEDTLSFIFISELYFPFTFTFIPWNQYFLEILPTTIMLLSQKPWSWQARASQPTPGPCMPPSSLTAPVGFSKTDKIQNTLFQAKWPQEDFHANRTESDKEYSLFRSFAHIKMHIWEELPRIKLKKHTTSFLWFWYLYFRQAWTNIANSIINDGSKGISSTLREKEDRQGGGKGERVRLPGGLWWGHPSCCPKLLLPFKSPETWLLLRQRLAGVRGHTEEAGRCLPLCKGGSAPFCSSVWSRGCAQRWAMSPTCWTSGQDRPWLWGLSR